MNDVLRYDLAKLINDEQYMHFIRKTLRQKVRGLRRRGLIATLYRAMQESGQRSFTGVEVGVKYGTLSQQILEMLPQVRQMILVDPWKEFPKDHSDREKFGYAGRSQHGWDSVANMCAKRMQPFGDRAVIMRKTSLQAAELYSTGLLNRPFFVYIDAGHSFEEVLEDCKAWFPIVQFGGILCGDDYQPKGHHARTESVSSAVEHFANLMGLPIIAHHRNFLIQKPD